MDVEVKGLNIGELIKMERKNNELTLREMGLEIGLSHSYLSQIESGQRKASPELLEKISKALNVDYMYLLTTAGYIDEPNDNFYEHLEIDEFRKMEYPDLEDFLKMNQVYFAKKRLSKDKRKQILNVLYALTEELEENYPTDEEIEKTYRLLKDITETAKERKKEK